MVDMLGIGMLKSLAGCRFSFVRGGRSCIDASIKVGGWSWGGGEVGDASHRGQLVTEERLSVRFTAIKTGNKLWKRINIDFF